MPRTLIRAQLVTVITGCIAFFGSVAAAAETAKSFDIPAGDASTTLKQFSAQAGEQLLYTMGAVKGVASKAVRGQMSAREALDQMFAGSALTVVRDRNSGTLSLVRAAGPNAESAAQPVTSGPRPNRPASDKGEATDERIELSPFSVSADRDVGYIAGSSLAGSRLNTDLKDTAASLSVLTKEFMDDIGATTVADAMAWSTNSQLTQGDVLALASTSDDVNSTFFNFDSFRVRGLSATQTKNYFDWTPSCRALRCTEPTRAPLGPNRTRFIGALTQAGLPRETNFNRGIKPLLR